MAGVAQRRRRRGGGTTALDVITYLDIAVRGRPTSTTPERTVEAMSRLFGLTVPGTGDVMANLGYGVVTALVLRYLYRGWDR